MKDHLITEIMQRMLPHLDNAQLMHLRQALTESLANKDVTECSPASFSDTVIANDELVKMFIAAKKVEGCSERTLNYYQTTLLKVLGNFDKNLTHITTDDLRSYLSDYQERRKCSKANIDNIRRILSSFFAWLEEENYILKSPVRRIHKIRTAKVVKETYTDEALEQMRDNCTNSRDLAMIDLLASTGMRVGEMVGLNRNDVDFESRECIVFGKGSKERPVYFDARTKIHLKNYLDSRTDENPALFVSLQKPHNRLHISGVEIRLRDLGRKLGIPKVHPHKFRRTLATRAIDKGMPIEQVQHLLGHTKIDTTMEYAMVDQNNVKIAHRKFIA
ncbi:MAG: tyrosine-type recombinase/integrase [Proteobacteria bacterium]|nr:tyrosine-type recombinase/integrase [Pseudomonadota bacterium]